MASVHKRVSARTGAVSWQVKYRTPEREARSATFAKKAAADRFARDVETAKDAGVFVDPQLATVTVSEWCSVWLAGKANLAASTRDRYENAIRAQIEPRWSRTPLGKVRHEDVQAWMVQLGEDLSAASVRKVHRVLSEALDYAVKAGRLRLNPAKGLSLPRVRAAQQRYLTHAQVHQFASLVPPEWRLLTLFLAYTGVRFGEAAALRVSGLDLVKRRAYITDSVTPVKGVLVWSDTKGHQARKVPLPSFLVKELRKHIAHKKPGDLVFLGPRGGVVRSSTYQAAALTPAARAMGLCTPKLDDAGEPIWRGAGAGRYQVMTGFFHPHEFRHTAASLAIAAGADVKVVQEMLGHKSATMTMDLYGHLFPDRLDVVADALERDRKAALKAAA